MRSEDREHLIRMVLIAMQKWKGGMKEFDWTSMPPGFQDRIHHMSAAELRFTIELKQLPRQSDWWDYETFIIRKLCEPVNRMIYRVVWDKNGSHWDRQLGGVSRREFTEKFPFSAVDRKTPF